MLELKFAIYYRAASLPSQASYAVLAEESQAFFKHSPHTNSIISHQQSCVIITFVVTSEGRLYLGTAIGSHEFLISHEQEKVEKWTEALHNLATIAMTTSCCPCSLYSWPLKQNNGLT